MEWVSTSSPVCGAYRFLGERIAIQRNDTEDSIVSELVEMGIPQERIDLNFIHPQHRELETRIEHLENGKISRTY